MCRLFSALTINNRVRLYFARFCTALMAVAGIIAATSGASAIGPTLPLQFRDEGRGIELLLDETHISKLDVERIIYDHGRPLRQQHLELRPEKRLDGASAAIVPLDLERLSDLPPGYYGMKIVAVGSPSDQQIGAVPLRIEWWVHFAVDKSGVRRMTEGEYSAAADPAEIGRSASGQQIFTHSGGELEGKVPLQQTEHGQAVPLGRSGGAVEELTTPRDQSKTRDEGQQR